MSVKKITLLSFCMLIIVSTAGGFCQAQAKKGERGIDLSKHLSLEPEPDTAAKRGVHDFCIVNAKPQYVWEAIKHQRNCDPTIRRQVSYDGTAAVIEEKFPGLPILGAASCTYTEVEQAPSRIDYTMIHSDKFKAFEGRWQLTPTNCGQSTKVELSSYLDPSIRVPFWQELTKMSSLKFVRKRLACVQAEAEKLEKEAKTENHVASQER